MNSRQESKLSMYYVVKDFLIANETKVGMLPNYFGFFTAFNAAIDEIGLYGGQQLVDVSGFTDNKSGLRDHLCMLAADVARKLTAYAKLNANAVLVKEVDVSESVLKKSADTVLLQLTENLYDRGQAHLADVSAYGITAASQTALQGAIAGFAASLAKPRLGINERRQSTLSLQGAFAAADGALDSIDALVEIIRLTEATFYSAYRGARKIVEKGAGSLAVKGLVADALNGMPIKGVNLLFMPDGAVKDGAISKRSAEKGGFNLKDLPAGVYRVRASKSGYEEQELSFSVAEGERSELVIELMKR